MIDDFSGRVTISVKNGKKSNVSRQEAASEVRYVEVTQELTERYVAMCPTSRRGNFRR